MAVEQAQEKQQALKRKAQLPEGDETMSSRKQRGGARLRRQKRRQQDVNMADAEQVQAARCPVAPPFSSGVHAGAVRCAAGSRR